MVRWQRANNPSTSPEQLEGLAADPDPWVRRAVAENPSTPPEVRRRLKEGDPDPKVQEAAAIACQNQRAWAVALSVKRVTFGWLGPWWTIATAVAVGVSIGAVVVWLLLGALITTALKSVL